VRWRLAGKNRRTWRRTRSTATSSSMNLTCSHSRLNPGHRCGKPTSSRPSHDTTFPACIMYSAEVCWILCSLVQRCTPSDAKDKLTRFFFSRCTTRVLVFHAGKHSLSSDKCTLQYPLIYVGGFGHCKREPQAD
jgi:hypothetical protein